MYAFSVSDSNRKNKKLMVVIYKNGDRIKTLHIGDDRYYDYIQYYKIDKDLANKRKHLYLQRHSKEDWNDFMKPAFWSVKLLWSYPTLREAIANIDLNR